MKTTEVQCPKCDREFKSVQALSMHNYRKHTHKGRRQNTTANLKRKKKPKVAATNGVHHTTLASLDEMVRQYSRASEIAAALAFLKQFGTVDYQEHQ